MTAFFTSLSPRTRAWLPFLALVAAVFFAYCNVYHNEFLFDDGLLITRNTFLNSWSTFGLLFTSSTTGGAHIAGGFYRPIQNILYFFVYQMFGQDTVAFHFVNITIHAANACLIFVLGRKLNFNPRMSFLVALIWAVHPIHTEAVTYMSATADPLFAFFCLWGLITLLPDFTPRKIMQSCILFLLALLTKETAVVFPLLAVLLLYYTSADPLKPKTYLRTWPLWVVMAIYLSWRLTTPYLDGPITYDRIYQLPQYAALKAYADNLDLRIMTFLATIPCYLALLIWPTDLRMERDFHVYAQFDHPLVLGGLILSLIAAWIIFFKRGRYGKPFGFGLLWFVMAHSPNTGLMVAANSIFLEHWMYLPSVGLFLGTGETLSRWLSDKRPKLKPFFVGATLVASLCLTFATLLQNTTWHDPIVFYTRIFKFGDISARAHNNLAMAYMEHGMNEQAIEEFHKAIAITDTYAETHHNLAILLLSLPDKEKHYPEAFDELNKALAIDPNFYRSYLVLAQYYNWKGDTQKANEYGEKGVELMKAQEH